MSCLLFEKVMGLISLNLIVVSWKWGDAVVRHEFDWDESRHYRNALNTIVSTIYNELICLRDLCSYCILETQYTTIPITEIWTLYQWHGYGSSCRTVSVINVYGTLSIDKDIQRPLSVRSDLENAGIYFLTQYHGITNAFGEVKAFLKPSNPFTSRIEVLVQDHFNNFPGIVQIIDLWLGIAPL